MIPRHVAISLEKNIGKWAEKNSRPIPDTYSARYQIVEEVLRTQITFNIPVVTIFLLKQEDSTEDLDIILNSISELFDKLSSNELIRLNLVRVSVFGKWYDLPSRPVDSIKRVMEQTETYDKFFLNFCVYYDGKEEIADACRLIAMKVKADKIDPDSITQELIKENLYSSYFLPPDVVIVNGDKRLDGFLLWDISSSRIYMTGKAWPEFTAFDLKKAIDLFKLSG
jgi:undecaprenyl diphosphate synthase